MKYEIFRVGDQFIITISHGVDFVKLARPCSRPRTRSGDNQAVLGVVMRVGALSSMIGYRGLFI